MPCNRRPNPNCRTSCNCRRGDPPSGRSRSCRKCTPGRTGTRPGPGSRMAGERGTPGCTWSCRHGRSSSRTATFRPGRSRAGTRSRGRRSCSPRRGSSRPHRPSRRAAGPRPLRAGRTSTTDRSRTRWDTSRCTRCIRRIRTRAFLRRDTYWSKVHTSSPGSACSRSGTDCNCRRGSPCRRSIERRKTGSWLPHRMRSRS